MNYELLGKVMTLVLNDDYYEKSTVWGTKNSILNAVKHNKCLIWENSKKEVTGYVTYGFLTQKEIDERRATTWNNIGNFLSNLNKGFQSGLNRGGGTGTVGTTPGGTPLTNTVIEEKQAGIGGDTTKISGYVLIAGVVLWLGYMAIKAASGPQPEFMND